MSNKQLHQAIDYSESMLKDAEAGNWENVYHIEAQRSALLNKLFSSSTEKHDVREMDDKIRKIIAINEKLEAITLKARDSTRDDICDISKGRHAVSSYTQTAYQ